MRPACIPGPLRPVGGTTRAPPVRRRSSCISANRKLTFTRANTRLAKRLFPPASLVLVLHPATTPCFQRMRATSLRCLAITWTVMGTSLDPISTLERIPNRKVRISMAPECRMRCFSEAVTRCIRATFHPLPHRMVVFACRDKWRLGFLKTPPSVRR